jgi:tetratricopeptide (TPR) repeat protein
VRDAHAAFLLDLARAPAPEWYRSTFSGLLALWTAEHTNLRAALGWPERTGQVEAALELAAASVFWSYPGPVSEVREWLRRLLAASAPAPTAARTKALEWSANLAGKHGAMDEAAALAAEAVPVARACGDRRLLAFILCTLGRSLRQQGKSADTQPYFEYALALFREVGPEEFAAVPLSSLGQLASDDGRVEEARALCQEDLDLRLQTGNEAGGRWSARSSPTSHGTEATAPRRIDSAGRIRPSFGRSGTR